MKFTTIIFLALFTLTASQANAGLKVSCSMFPVYDFTREITAGQAEISLILKPGTEPHDFEPSPRDIKALHDSDVFVFTGPQMEHWAERIADSLTGTRIADASHGISLTGNDPHIWLDLDDAQKMVRNILAVLCCADPENADTYTSNAEAFCSKLADLDAKFMTMAKNKPLVFTGEFSYGYFVRRYGFDYVSAYDGENEPGIKRMADIIRYIREHKSRFVLADDPPLSQVTLSISEQTGAEILTFSSVHNVRPGKTFLQVMADNLAAITRFLND
ncbi:MAG: zinc ABC transporter substrate-binding protein [Synergistaceae bacterium]|nr:zinc ABC transporter substrate-binding protein [Synergistaceae bacterium]